MLKREKAEEELEKLKDEKWEDKRLAAVTKLPKHLCRVGRFLFNRDPETGKPFRDWQKRHEIWQKMPAEMADLTPADRTGLFTTLFPHLGETIEAAWQLTGRLPYEIDGDRRGFRAPNDPTLTNEARYYFVDRVISTLKGYDPTPSWLAAWAPYLSEDYESDAAGILLAAAIDQGGTEGEEVYQTLIGSINRTHPIGAMGRHVTRGLLVASRPDGWEAIEKLLLAAQRQEGLRQTILETVDEAHPEAFRRMLRLVLDNDLLRFSATVRAAMVWFGIRDQADDSGSRLKKAVTTVLGYFDDPAACRAAVAKTDGDDLYFGLWTLAYEDATQVVPLVVPLLDDKKVERRYLGVQFLKGLQLPASRLALVKALDDDDLRVALSAYDAIRYSDSDEDTSHLFEPLTRLVPRLPQKATELKKIGPDNDEITAHAQDVADDLPDHLGKRDPELLLPYLPQMSGNGRAGVVSQMLEAKTFNETVRTTLFSLLGDRDGWVRNRVLEGLKKVTLTPGEAAQVEALLTRKSADLREEALKLLAKQKAEPALASADRLVGSRNANQRLAGLELLRQMVASKKNVAAARERATAFLEKYPKPNEAEQSHLDAIQNVQREVPTLANALGLLDRSQLTPGVAPVTRKAELITPAARAILAELDRFVTQNAKTMVRLEFNPSTDDDDFDDDDDDDGDGNSGTEAASTERNQMPLGGITWELPNPRWDDPREQDLARMPLRDELTRWWNDRPEKMRDDDGLELHRAMALSKMDEYIFQYPGGNKKSAPFQKAMKAILGGVEKPVKLKHSVVGELLEWVQRAAEPHPKATDWLLDATEMSLAAVPDEILNKKRRKSDYNDWRNWNIFEFWLDKINDVWERDNRTWTPEQKVRYFALRRWLSQPTPASTRRYLEWDLLAVGYESGQVNLADLTEALLGPRGDEDDDLFSGDFDALEECTRRPVPELLTRRPEVAELVERCRQRVLEIELARGDLPTPATAAAQALESVVGLDTLCRLLTALGRRNLTRDGYGDSKVAVLSHLLARCYPTEGDTLERFGERMREMIKAETIRADLPMQLAFVNSRWVDHIAHFLQVPDLAEGVWWCFAHMQYATPDLPESLETRLLATRSLTAAGKEDEDEDGDHRSAWDRLITERTTLSEEDREEGAVDTDWFHRVYTSFGPKRWDELLEACKYGDSSYKTARKLSDVLRGKVKKTDLIREVRDRRLKGSVRLLGLLPLAKGDKREADLTQRWKALGINEYRKYAHGLSPMSREDAIRTGEIGMANLARTAGFTDPNRLGWAMEWKEIQDLAAGPVVAKSGDVTVSLTLDDQAQPVTVVQRGEKVLKAIPPKVRKDKKVAALVERKAQLKQQASRIRLSLETMMIRGDTIRGDELPQLLKHPLVAKNLSRLVLVGEGIRGYPVAEGQALENHAGTREPVKKDEVLRLAHPLDLLEANDWHDWQAHCFRIERVQPFKQIFRELYLLTDAERADRTFSRRYSGQQVNENQAMALFGSRGWRTMDGVEKTFPEQNLVAVVNFQYGGGTPLEVEGQTIDRLRFHRRGEWESLPLSEIPQRLLSEVLRDLDLVVSVAHVGGVDPEASASTVEMRASLAMELCSLLGLKNVQRKASHLLIDGTLGKYSLHLGSGTVHKMPGGAVCIVSVPAQHRGRIFLPFADNDPRTAEVIAKLLLLSRDEEIQDPGILDQLRR